MELVIGWTCVVIVIIFFLGMFIGTTKWFDSLMKDIGKLLKG